MAAPGANGGQPASAVSGEKKQRELIAFFAELRDRTPIVTSCLFCDWSFEGTAGEAREAARAHRVAEHPEACVRKPRTRSRRVKRGYLRSEEEQAQIAVDAAEARRVRQEREDAERLEKVLRGLARDAA